jgi:hypothetical protein
VYLFYGTEPMYRPFTSGMSDGRDVGELNRDLRAMGYDSGEAIDMRTVDHFQTATGAAIDRWQKAHGLGQTGELDLGRVAFLPGARRIETVELSIGGPAAGSAGGSGGGSIGSSGGSNGTAASYEQSGAARAVEVSLVRVTSTATTPTTNTLTTTTPPPLTTTTTTGTPSTLTTSTTAPTTSTTSTTTTTATTPTAARVPNVTGDSTRAATSALIAARFTVAEHTKAVTDKDQNGVVLYQSPAGGVTVNMGSAVTITVGRYSARSQTSTGTRRGTTPPHSSPRLSSGGSGARNTHASRLGAAGASGGLGAGASGAGGAGGVGAGASSGSAPSPASNVALVTTSTDMVVTVQLDASSQTEAVVGERVYVTLPSNAVAQGVITRVGRVAQTSSQPGGGGSSPGSGGNSTSGPGSAPSATIPVTISLRHAGGLGSLDQAPVTVAFALTTTRHALSIPVSALLATAGGGYAVDVVQPNGIVVRTPVTPGSFAGGFVQISGPGIAAGMQVRDTAGG